MNVGIEKCGVKTTKLCKLSHCRTLLVSLTIFDILPVLSSFPPPCFFKKTKPWQLICLTWVSFKVLMKLNLPTCVYFGSGCLLAQGLPILRNLLHRKKKELGVGVGRGRGRGSHLVMRQERNTACLSRRRETLYVSKKGKLALQLLIRSKRHQLDRSHSETLCNLEIHAGATSKVLRLIKAINVLGYHFCGPLFLPKNSG